MPRGSELPATVASGPARTRAKDLEIDIDPATDAAGGTRLRARTPDVAFDIVAELPEGHERLAVVVPWSSTRFEYTVKDTAPPHQSRCSRHPSYPSTTTSRRNLGIVSARTDQCFEHWSGTFTVPGERAVAFARILGWTEEVHNRW